MNVFVFEDQAATALGVLVAARPACDLTIGSQTLFEALRHFGSVRRCVRPHLARHLASLTGGRCAIWGGAADAARDAAAASRHGSLALLVNARVIPSRDNLFAVRSLVEHGRRCVVRSAGHVADDDVADADAADADAAKILRMHHEVARPSLAPHITDRLRRCRLQILTAASLAACPSTCAANVAALHSLRAHRDEHSALAHHESRTRLLDRSVTVLAAPTCRLAWRASRFHPTLRHSCARSLRPLVALLTALLR